MSLILPDDLICEICRYLPSDKIRIFFHDPDLRDKLREMYIEKSIDERIIIDDNLITDMKRRTYIISDSRDEYCGKEVYKHIRICNLKKVIQYFYSHVFVSYYFTENKYYSSFNGAAPYILDHKDEKIWKYYRFFYDVFIFTNKNKFHIIQKYNNKILENIEKVFMPQEGKIFIVGKNNTLKVFTMVLSNLKEIHHPENEMIKDIFYINHKLMILYENGNCYIDNDKIKRKIRYITNNNNFIYYIDYSGIIYEKYGDKETIFLDDRNYIRIKYFKVLKNLVTIDIKLKIRVIEDKRQVLINDTDQISPII